MTSNPNYNHNRIVAGATTNMRTAAPTGISNFSKRLPSKQSSSNLRNMSTNYRSTAAISSANHTSIRNVTPNIRSSNHRVGASTRISANRTSTTAVSRSGIAGTRGVSNYRKSITRTG